MIAPVSYDIYATFTVRPSEYVNKTECLAALGTAIDDFTRQYGGLVVKLNHTTKEYEAGDKIMIDSISAVVRAEGTRIEHDKP